MAIPDNDPSVTPAAAPARPSWETARPASAPRPAPTLQRPAPAPAPSYAPSAAPAPASVPPAAAAYQAPAYQPPADLEGNVKYDLAGNPIPGSGSTATPMTSAIAPPAPFGYSAGQAAAGTWPPPVGGAGYGAQAYRNNSGEQSHLPPELERLRWHWGAFFFPILWTKKHGLTTVAGMLTGGLIFLRVLRMIFMAIDPLLYLGICVFYGVAYFGLQIYGGLNGHKIGWRNRHFPGGVEEYFKVQSAWMWWGFGINIVVVPLLYFGIFAAIIAAAFAGHSSNSGAYGSYGSYGSYNNGSYGSGYHRHYYSNGSNYGNGSTPSNGSSDGGSQNSGQ